MILKLLAGYWQYILIAALVASTAAAGGLWRAEVAAFSEYRATVAATGKAAEAEAKRIEEKQNETLKELSNAYAKTVPLIESHAVANYRRMHPSASCRQVPAATNGTQGADGVDGPGILACEPEFIQRCAGAVLKVGLCRDWIQRNGFPVEQ